MKLSQEDKEKIQKLRSELASLAPEIDSSSYGELELDSFLRFQRSIPAAARALLNSRKWKREHPVSIADVAPFHRAPAGYNSPPGCLVCLEDGRGDVARDQEGRPIVCMMGMVYGSEEELKQQIAYALQRAAVYRLPHHRPDEVCFVTEVASRETGRLGPTFRFPDAGVRSLFDFMKTHFPGSQFSVVHFCGLPSFVVGFFKMIKPFVSAEIFDRLNLKSNFAHLKKDGHIHPSSLLPNWDREGEFQFDLDRYVEWRAQQEGIRAGEICRPGQGRKFEGALFGMPVLGVTTQEVLGTAVAREKVIKSGWAEKQGSGMGLFSSNRWKSKYMVLRPGLFLYFESAKVSTSNAASRVIVIDESSSVGRLANNTEGEKRFLVLFQSADREYVFGFSSEDEADEWTRALQKECDEARGSVSDIVKPASVASLCVGDFDFVKHDMHLRTTLTLRQQ